jgi:raffinose/stachyose/melibiose transport system permease protein
MRSVSKAIILLSLLALACVCLWPVVFMTLTTFRTRLEYLLNPIGLPTRLEIQNYIVAIVYNKALISFKNSAIVCIPATALVLALGSLASYSLTKVDLRINQLILMVIISTMMIPGIVLLIPIYVLFSRMQLVNNYLSLITIYAVVGLPYSIYLMTANFRHIPNELIESAKLDGATFLTVYVNIIVPLGRMALFTVAILQFVAYWNELLLSLMLLNKDALKTVLPAISASVAKFRPDPPQQITRLFLSMLPLMLLYAFLQKHIIAGVTAGSLKD